jgi:hypothetical protein
VGAPPAVHIELASEQPPSREYFVAAYRDGRETQRLQLRLTGEKSPFFGTVRLKAVPSDVALYARCQRDARTTEVARQVVSWPGIEADAEVRPDREINPVDLGAILVPKDRLLLAAGQAAVIDAAAISHARAIGNARLMAWFDGERPVETAIALRRDRRATQTLTVPLAANADRTVLHVRLVDGNEELWKKDIHTMIVNRAPRWPAFGAVETKLRYDAPIPVKDPKTGVRSSISYDTAWDPKLNDVAVFLPNGQRFVFWRGASYVPFWADRENTGFAYEWVETVHPEDGVNTSVEPLGDKALRYARVRIVESTASRVHVRWVYQPTHDYRVWGDQAAEDFYFYPDGFGTRVLTVTSAPNWRYEMSEFIVLTPAAAYPLDVLNPVVEALYLDGKKQRVAIPKDVPATGRVTWSSGARVFRILGQKDDRASAIYFSPFDQPGSFIAFTPFSDAGEQISPAFWGSHWPLSRDESSGLALIADTPAHNSLMTWGLSGEGQYSIGNNPKPLSTGTAQSVDTLGRSRELMTRRWAWLIGKTDAPDETVLAWAQSYASPPAIEVTGARVDFPTYSPERRALRVVAESPEIEIRVKPVAQTMNPVFEIAAAPGELLGVTIDRKPSAAASYAWDGATLWVKAGIDAKGATIRLRFGTQGTGGSASGAMH